MTNKAKALELIKKYTSIQKSGNGDWINSVILAQYAKKAVELAAEPDWHDVKENLPEKNKIVLCQLQQGSMSGWTNCGQRIGYVKESGMWSCNGDLIRVSHWMHLPNDPNKA